MLNALPIRWRLAIWYFSTLAAILTLVAVGSRVAMQRSLERALDLGLTYQMASLRDYIADGGAGEPDALRARLAPISVLSDLFRVYDEGGRLVCESTALTRRDVKLAAPPDADSTIRFRSTSAGFPLRMAFQRVPIGARAYILEVADPVRKFGTALDEVRTLFWVSLPLLLVLGSLGGLWLSTRALRPVDQLTEDARAITASDLSRRLAVPAARDELRRLSETLNGMLDRIETSFHQVHRFTADASHELRTPVTLIHTAAEFSLRRERSADELNVSMRQILREAKRTARLIDDLLLLARADAGGEAFRPEPIDLAPIVEDVAVQAEALAQPGGVALVASSVPDPLPIRGDGVSLRRLLLILVDNAVRYTPAGGRVTIDARRNGADILVSVADTGPGIAREDLARVFERFWRADKARTREPGGAGLGLAIAREVADRHGARLTVESDLGQGSTFTLILPARRP
jgi:heavy metal sensor kinase